MEKKHLILASATVILFIAASYYLYQKYNPFTYYDDEVHVHADFLIYIDDQKMDLTSEKYQSSTKQILHKNVHLHDGDDNVVHRHAEGITFAEFLASVGFTLTNECLTNDEGTSYCSNNDKVLSLFVNKVPKTIITEYIPQEEDQVLLYFGTRDNQKLSEYQNSITDESCIFSGTCPERGIAPAESCGLTCEI
jgi:hypothetical protein